MRKMAASNVLIVGMSGLGVEIGTTVVSDMNVQSITGKFKSMDRTNQMDIIQYFIVFM